ncbi:MAG: chorismate synthase [Treponema sp.]|jgi:chorismate synthase|nr:chorismate synthase [Treponema sp.]
MGGNSFGTLFIVATFGESHGPAIGCVVDGCPAGLPLSADDINRDLTRRKSYGSGAESPRIEKDECEILSGVFDGKTLGTPIAVLIRNEKARPEDYDNLKDVYRPGHADWTWEAKYGIRDYRGGGRSSARETVGRVAAGAIARVFLASMGIEIRAWTSQAAGVNAPCENDNAIDWNEIENNPLRMPDRAAAAEAMEKIEQLKTQGDSTGCLVSCVVRNLTPGLGEPVFDKLDARIAAAMLSLGSAKGIEFGAGFAAAMGVGSELNDRLVAFAPGRCGGIWKTNNAGGVLGGLSTGAELRFTVAFKPVPSIMKAQETINRVGEKTEIQIQGRHDVCVAPRAVPVVEAMTALVLADFVLLQRSARV